MLKTLLKKQMAEIFRNYFYDPKKNKMRSRGATIAYIALYALLMVGLLGGMFALMAVGLCGPLVEGGMGWLYYLLMGLIAVFLGTFGSVFSTYSSLYLSKDNDLLLSLPIPVRCVMASRLLGVYLLGLMYAAVVIVPGVIVYWLTAPVTAGTIVGGVLMVLIVSVIVMVLSCLLGWVVARISLKLKNKSFITVLLSLLFLAAYYFVYYKAQALITLLVENAAVYGMKIRGSAYLLYLFGSVGAGDWLAMGIAGGAPRADAVGHRAQLPEDRHGDRQREEGALRAQGRARAERAAGAVRQGAAPLCREPELYAQLRARHSDAAGGGHRAAHQGRRARPDAGRRVQRQCGRCAGADVRGGVPARVDE